MLGLLYPKEYLDSFKELTPKKIKAIGAKTVIFDIDNTLVPYWVKTPTPEIISYFEALKSEGIDVAVLSNSRKERSEIFCRGLSIPYVWKAKKPFKKGFSRLVNKLSIDPAKCIIVGDQIFTDVLLGNLRGVYSVLVKKVNKKDELVTAVKRPLEKIVLFFYLRSKKNE